MAPLLHAHACNHMQQPKRLNGRDKCSYPQNKSMAPSSTAVFWAVQAVTAARQQMQRRSPAAVNACWYSTGFKNLAYLQTPYQKALQSCQAITECCIAARQGKPGR